MSWCGLDRLERATSPNMISTQSSTRPEAVIPPASLATDFDEWMARWTFKFNGYRYPGKPIPTPESVPGEAWKSFKRKPRPSAESQLSPRLKFLASITSPKNPNPSTGHFSSTSFDSFFTPPARQEEPLFKTDFFEVRKSVKGGYGAFAVKDIEVDTVIMSEEPAIQATFGEVYYMYENLTTEQRAEYRSLHGWHELVDDSILAIFKTNRFQLPGGQCGIFLKSSRFNHACHPHATCTYRWNEIERRMIFTSINPMKKGDEITISYTSHPGRLYADYGFYCDCPSCPPPKEVAAIERRCRLSY